MKKMMLLAVALVALIASPASAQYSGSTLVLSKSSIVPGGSLDVSCNALKPGAPYSFTFDGKTVGTGTVNADGTAVGTFTSDSSTAPGTHQLAIVTADGSCTGTVQVLGATVNPQNPANPGFTPNSGGNNSSRNNAGNGTLARTGASDNLRTYAIVGAGLIALGGMLTLTKRRKASI